MAGATSSFPGILLFRKALGTGGISLLQPRRKSFALRVGTRHAYVNRFPWVRLSGPLRTPQVALEAEVAAKEALFERAWGPEGLEGKPGWRWWKEVPKLVCWWWVFCPSEN